MTKYSRNGIYFNAWNMPVMQWTLPGFRTEEGFVWGIRLTLRINV